MLAKTLLVVILVFMLSGKFVTNSLVWGYSGKWVHWKTYWPFEESGTLFTEQMLAKYDGSKPELPVYIAVRLSPSKMIHLTILDRWRRIRRLSQSTYVRARRELPPHGGHRRRPFIRNGVLQGPPDARPPWSRRGRDERGGALESLFSTERQVSICG